MKVALCLSGHMRKYKETAPSIINNIINPTGADVFIYTSETLGYHNQFRADAQHLINDKTQYHLNEINKLFRPKKIEIQPDSYMETFYEEIKTYLPHLVGDPNVPKSPAHMAAQYYKIWYCNDMRKYYERDTGVRYDIVIRARPDLFFTTPITQENLIQAKTKLSVPSIENYAGINDQFALGNPHMMDFYSMMYHSLPRYFRDNNPYIPEMFVAWYLRTQEIPYFHNNIYYHMYR